MSIKINNIDTASYGFTPVKYLESLFTFPKAKEVSFIDWYEGQVDYDLRYGVQFEKQREIEIEFYSKDYANKHITFIESLMTRTYNSFVFQLTNETLRLRLKEQVNNDLFGDTNLSKIRLKFIEENYTKILSYDRVECPIVNNLISIDDININRYGMILIDGVEEILRYKNTHEREKEALVRINKKVRDIKLKLACTSLYLDDFTNNLYSFFYLLTKEDIRNININYRGFNYRYKGFYTGMEIEKMIIHGFMNKVWCEFYITMKIW